MVHSVGITETKGAIFAECLHTVIPDKLISAVRVLVETQKGHEGGDEESILLLLIIRIIIKEMVKVRQAGLGRSG